MTRFRLHSSETFIGQDVMEHIPDLEGGQLGEMSGGIDNNSTSKNQNYPVSPSQSTPAGLSSSSMSSIPPEHAVVVNRMTTLEYLWRRHVRTSTNNTTVQAVLDRILLVFLFLANIMEQPLKYLLGNTGTTSTQPPPKVPSTKVLQTQVTKGTVKTSQGVIAYRISQGRNPKKHPILCLHSSGRSSDEFFDILPQLADTDRRIVAIDLPGYGWSDNPKRVSDENIYSLDEMANSCLKVADALLIEQFVCLASGSLGSLIAISLASRYHDRVKGAIHVNLLYKQPTRQETGSTSATTTAEGEAAFHFRDDGSHLLELHNRRKLVDPDLSLRCVQVDLANLILRRERQVDGITIQGTADYDIESAARKVRCPILCMGGETVLLSLDGQGMGGTQRFDTACRMLPHCEVNLFSGPTSTIHMLNEASKEITSLCSSFLEKHSL